MTRRRPESLSHLAETFGDGPLFEASPDDEITIDGVTFVSGYVPESTAERFYIVKRPPHVAELRELAREVRGGTIVELGIAEGGSTALLALEAGPRRLVAVDLEPERLVALDDFVAARALGEVVRAHYGVDQADRATLTRILDEDLGDHPIDLVVDDASHALDPTRASFDLLFPRLAPGGLYVIEDWAADHAFRDAVLEQVQSASPDERAAFAQQLRAQSATGPQQEAGGRPLLDLAVELLLARAGSGGDAFGEIVISRFWIRVRRGTAPLDPETFRLGDLVRDHFRYLHR